jgi:cytochrome c2
MTNDECNMKTCTALVLCFALTACSERTDVTAGVSGDPQRGQLLLRQYGCGGCHEIPGVAAADGKVGPPLDGIARRVYLGGVLPNMPQNMVRWIRAPQSVDPKTAMPDMQVPEAHAQDMVAYLYTLR